MRCRLVRGGGMAETITSSLPAIRPRSGWRTKCCNREAKVPRNETLKQSTRAANRPNSNSAIAISFAQVTGVRGLLVSCLFSLGRCSVFRRERGDNFLEARIATERVPKRESLEHAVARARRCPDSGLNDGA